MTNGMPRFTIIHQKCFCSFPAPNWINPTQELTFESAEK